MPDQKLFIGNKHQDLYADKYGNYNTSCYSLLL